MDALQNVLEGVAPSRRLWGLTALLLFWLLACSADAASGPPPPPPPPYPPGSSAGVALHVSHVRTRLAGAQSRDDTARHALAEARVSVEAAQGALNRGDLSGADQLAASGDELIRAADPSEPPAHPGPIEPARILTNVDTIATTLADVASPRVRNLLAFAQAAAGVARREAALQDPNAGLAAIRAEAIARAAAHVAIADNPSLDPSLLHPPPPPPSRGE